MSALCAVVRGSVARFCRAREGIAATEFALVLPLMITLYFGVITFSDGFAVKQRLQFLARTAADLVGRLPSSPTGALPTINAAEITNVALASAAILTPYDPAGLTIALASVVVRLNNGNLEGRVCWSAARKIVNQSTVATAAIPAHLAQNALVAVPAGFAVPGASYLVSEVGHVYTPVVGHAITGDVQLTDRVPWPVRSGQQIAWQGQAPCPAT
jgi:Flp pilus assembly protein TadG